MNESRKDIVIRRASASDERALRRLAALDNAAAPLAGPDVLIAEVAGHIVAAARGDAVIADPFQRTAELVALLRVRVSQLAVDVAPIAPRRKRRLRFRPAPAPRPLPQG